MMIFYPEFSCKGSVDGLPLRTLVWFSMGVVLELMLVFLDLSSILIFSN